MENIKIPIHKRNLKARLNSLPNWKIPEQEKKDIKQFLGDLELGKINKGKKISKGRQLKYLDILKVPLAFFDKPNADLTIKDMEGFDKALTSNKIKSSHKKEPYSSATKADFRRLLKIYLKWKLGDTEKYRKLTDWLDMRVPTKTPNYLSEAEIEKLYKACKNNSERYLIAVLFDSGARAEEFHNIRYEDIQIPSKNENFVKITIKTEYSKTEGRTISLYWKNSLEAVRDYLQEREAEKIKSNEPVFKNTYDNMRQFLNRLGKKVLKKSIHYHLFRHSSATYYAAELNRQQLCYRYGWKFSSNMPDVYISRAGMNNKEIDEKFSGTELEDLKRQLEKSETSHNLEMENIKKLLDLVVKKNTEILGEVEVKLS